LLYSASYSETKRLIKQYRKHGRLERKHRTTNGFQLKYTREDKLLLAALDVRHNTLSGPATKKLCALSMRIKPGCPLGWGIRRSPILEHTGLVFLY
jgi:hypothetical protein